jgi:hypothetical protein
MIEFKGKLSAQCKKYLVDSSWKIGLGAVIAVCIPFGIFFIVLSIINDPMYLLTFIPLAMMISFASLKPCTKPYRILFGKNGKIFDGELEWHITVEEGMISAEGIQRAETEYLDDIKKVVDMGDWYKIYFYFPHKSNIFIVQKDLITQGTIEEFESLLQDKIVRRVI